MKSLCLLLALVPVVAHADKKSEADALFKKAKKLQGEKRYSEACQMFEKTDSLDPGIGAKVNAARCYEEWGMLARAYRWYTDAYDMALKTKDDRADKIKPLIDALDPDVPKLTIKVPDDAPVKGADIRLDGKPVDAGKQLRVDPGPHEITWYVEGKRKTKTIPLERGGETESTLDFRVPAGEHVGGTATGTTNLTKQVDEPEQPGRTRRIVAYTAGAVGLVGLGVATYLTLDARSSYNDALDSHCMGSSSMCDDEGLSTTRDARTQANVATIITVVSLGAIGTGVWLYLTAPKGESKEKTVYVRPLVDEHGGGLVVGGGF
jgi:tetratricopeptide (TPR) repeat protein